MAQARKAKKALAKRAATTSQPKQSPAVVKIGVDVSDDTPTYYANHIEISHGAHDFTLSASRLPTKLSPQKLELAKANGTLRIDAMVQVVVPTSLVKGLLDALQRQAAAYEKTFGPLKSKAETAGEKNGKTGA